MGSVLTFQGTFKFLSSHLKKQADRQPILDAGIYIEEKVPQTPGPKKTPEAWLECPPDKDQFVGTYLMQKQIPFKFEPTQKIKKQMK